jgi:hypothetical protein
MLTQCLGRECVHKLNMNVQIHCLLVIEGARLKDFDSAEHISSALNTLSDSHYMSCKCLSAPFIHQPLFQAMGCKSMLILGL